MSDLLLNDFFTITGIETDEDHPEKIEAGIVLNPTHAVYGGHFPGHPVVPGVCIVQMIKEVLSQHLQKELLLITSEEIKFLNLIVPTDEQALRMEIKIKYPGDERVHASVVVRSHEHVFTKFRGSFR